MKYQDIITENKRRGAEKVDLSPASQKDAVKVFKWSQVKANDCKRVG